MLFAEVDLGDVIGPGGWVIGIAGVGLAIVGWLRTKIASNAHLLARVDQLTTQVFGQNDRIFEIQKSEHECLQREADLKAELVAGQGRLSRLEKHTGVEISDPITGIVIGNYDGIIEEFSPALTSLLGWHREEIIGQSITVLVPPELMTQHMTAFKLFRADTGRETDPERILLTYALSKTGTRVPVSMRLRSWPHATPNMITATITERAAEPTNSAVDNAVQRQQVTPG